MKARVLERIRAGGPIGFDEYMEMALYDPEDGFFAGGAVRPGVSGDFVTSPEVSPWFGKLLGRWASERAIAGTRLIEIGAGSGALLETLLAESGEVFAAIYATERSGEAREALEQRLADIVVTGGLDEIPPGGPAIVIMNEVLDNVPFQLVERTSSSWLEVRVGERDGDLAFVTVPADGGLSAWCDDRLGSPPGGARLAAQRRAEVLLEAILSRFENVDILAIDYGATTAVLVTRNAADVVRGYAGHRRREDFLDAPGRADITADVNVDAVVTTVTALGGSVSVTDQRSLLVGLGAEQVLSDLDDASLERARAGDVMGQLTRRSEATGVTALLDRAGLGGFTVFHVSSGTG